MPGKQEKRSRLRTAVDSIVRSLMPSTTVQGARARRTIFAIEPLEERQLLSGTLTIAQENALTGSPVSAWNVASGGDLKLDGFTTDISYNQGNTVSFKVDNEYGTAYQINIFRLGYYQGLGARSITSIANPTITAQPAPITDSTGLIDCGNWSVSATWAIPANATSGLYVADLIKGGTPVSQIPFVVRDDTDHSKILYQTSDSTWEAYNSYGGNSLYESTTSGGLGSNDDGNTPRAFSVSYNRPFVNRGENEGPQEGYIFGSEYPMIRFMEQNGYDVSYATDVDTARYGSHLLDHKVVMTSGHDEYWSPEMRTNMMAARDAGVNLAMFAGNEQFWKIRWQASSDTSHANWRTIVCYKETLADAKIDPTSDFTGLWRDPRFPTYFAGIPENSLDGTISTVNGVRNDSLSVAYPDSLDRFWRNTTVASLGPGQSKTFPAGTLGYEWDEDLDNGYRPAGLIDMSHTTMDVTPKYTLNYAGDYGAGTATHSLTLYKAASGALVFSAGETQWSWGLDTNHDRTGGAVQPVMQQATINLFADMGVQPATLMAGLVAATISADTLAPTSMITAPTPSATLANNVPVTITGTATDAGGGIVAGVEVSTDGGVTWHPATGTNNWSYTWTPRVQGNVRIMTRATDDSANIETPSVGRGVVVTASGSFTVFPASQTPQTGQTASTAPATLGMRFVSDVSGQVLGIRYYKGATETGTHIGSLWSNTGTLLATATFTGESSSGWQQVNFSAPVNITAGTVYVASYFVSAGHYFGDDHGIGRTIDAGPLHILADGYNQQPDGIFSTAGSNTFPATGDEDTNFFVDVVFQQTPGDTTRPTVLATTPSAGPASSPVSSVSITFSESIEQSTLSFTLTGPGNVPVPANLSYNNTTHVAMLTPTGALTAGAAYAVRVNANDLALNSLAQPYTFSFTTPQNYSIWTPSTTPANLTSSTSSGIELGVRFKSDVAGYISGLMFYKGGSTNSGPHIGDLWNDSGSLLASATFGTESASGWQTVTLATPVAINANTTYVASYYAPNGHYSFDSNYFSTAHDNAPLHALADGTGGEFNGVSIATSAGGVFPTTTAGGKNFWVDVVFTSANVDTSPPIVASTIPATGAIGIAVAAPITATFDGPINPSTLTFTLKTSGGVIVPSTVTYNSSNNTATLTPGALLNPNATYAASITATDTSGNAMSSPYAWTFTTVSAPQVVSRSPGVNGTGAPETTPIVVTFNEALLAGSITFTLTGAGGVNVPGSVSYNTSNFTASFQPTSTLTSLTSYTASIAASDQSGNPMVTPVTWSFTTAAPGTIYTTWPSTTGPVNSSQADNKAVEVGVRFTSDSSGFITGIRFYKGSGNIGTHIGNLWTDLGVNLGTATFINESTSGWQQVLFDNPIAITAGTTYVASYYAPKGRYADDDSYFLNNGYDNAPLHMPVDGFGGDSNGVFLYAGISKFPTNASNSTNYWVDVTFMTAAPPNKPTGLAAAAGANQNVLTWTAAARATSYNIYRGTTSGGEAVTPVATGVTGLTFTDTGLTPGTQYFYYITGVDAAGVSVGSSEVSATPIKASPAITGITSQTITYGASTITVSGTIAAGTQIPSGNVVITINGVPINATITAGTGAFSASFDTHAIPASATAYTMSISFAANANFNATSDTSHTLTVNKRTLTVSATGINRVYDGTTAATVTLADNRINSDNLTFSYGATYANKSAANGKTVTVSGLTLGGTAAGNYTLAATTVTTTANITKFALTVGATGSSRVYDSTRTDIVTLSDNRISGDSLSLAYGSALFVDKNVGTGKSISVSSINVTGGDAGNYTWNATATTTANITPFALTVTATGQNRIYDSTVTAPIVLSDNRFGGDVLNLAFGSATFPDKNVGTAKPISVSGINVTGTDANNYTWNGTASTSANVMPFALTVSASAQNKVYDQTPSVSASVSDNRFSGDQLSVTFSAASFADKNAGVGKTVTVSGINVTGTDVGNYTWNATATTAATITPLALTVSATGQDKPYDRSVNDVVTLGDNRLSGDVFTLSYASATFADKNVGVGKTVTVSGIGAAGTDALNYSWNASASTTATITSIALTVSAAGVNRVYDGTSNATVNLSDNRIAGDSLTLSYGAAIFSDKNVGASKPVSVTGISVTGADAINYTFNQTASTMADITKATLAVTATAAGKIYDGSPTTTATLSDNRITGDSLTVTYTAANFSDKNVGATKTVTISGISVVGTDAGNYNWNLSTTATAAITKRTLTVSATGIDRAYDQTTVATVSLGDNRVSGDALTLSYGSAAFADKNAGTNKPVSVSSINVVGTDAGNYAWNATASTTANVTPRVLHVTATAQDKPYDTTTTASVTLADDRISGDVLTIGSASANFSDKNAGTNKTVSILGIAVSGTDSTNYSWNASTTTTASITKIALTVSAAGIDRVYDGSTAATVNLSDNRLASDSLTLSYLSASYADKNVGTGKAVSVSGISVAGTDAGNYTFNTTASTTASIMKRSLTVSATGQNRPYDQSTTATVTLGDNRVSGDLLNLTYGAASFTDKNAGVGKTVAVSGINVTGTDAGNYSSNATTTTTATITPIALLVTAAGQDRAYDSTANDTVILSDNRLSGDVLTASYASATFADKNIGASKPVGISGIAITGTDALNYTVNTSASTTASITPFAMTVNAAGQNKTYDGTATGAAVLTGNAFAGDDITLSYASASFADKNVGTGKSVSVTGITATGADAGNYTWNAAASTTAAITKRMLTITATAQNKPYDQSTAASSTLADNRVSGDVLMLGFTGANFADKNAGTNKTVTVSGITLSGTDCGNYFFMTSVTTKAAITPIALTISAEGASRVYTGTNAASVTLSDNRLSGDSLTLGYGSATFADKNVGTAKPIGVSGITVGGADAINYTFNQTATTSADITPFALTVAAVGQNKPYDRTNIATVTLTDNRFSGDVLNLAYASATFADKNAGVSKPVSVTGISVTGADSANYTFNNTASTTATITPLALTISAAAQNKPYDGSALAAVTLSDNRLAGDSLTFGYVSAMFADKNAGAGKTVTISGITVGGADANNYTFNSTATTTASISQIALTIGAVAQGKMYDARTNATVTLTDNRIAGDNLTITFASANFGDKNVQSNKVVTVGGINVVGPDATNYTFNNVTTTTANITPFALTVGASGQNKTYDQTTTAGVTLVDNHIAGDNVTVSYTAANFADKNAGAGKLITVTGIGVTGADAANYTWNGSTTTTATITQRALLVSASAQNKPYDRGTTAIVGLSDNRISGDLFTLGYASASFSDKNAGVGKTVTVAGITVSGTDALNYAFNNSTTTTATITPIALTISAAAQSRTYDGTAGASVTLSDNRLAGDNFTIAFSGASFDTKNAGVGKTVTVSGITISGPDALNYNANGTATTTAAISKFGLIVSASAQNKTYDQTAAAQVTLSDNRIAGDLLSITSTSATFSDKNAGAGKTVTVTGINVSGTDAGNYTFNNTATTTASIAQRALLVTAAAQNKPYDRGTTAVVTLGDNRISGDGLTIGFGAANFSDKNAAVGKTVTITGITVTGIDALNYAFNNSTTATATITPIALTITPTAQSKIYDRTTTASVTLGDNRLAGDILTISNTGANFSDKNVGTSKTITVAGITISGTDALNYTVNPAVTTTANITPRVLTITATAQNRIYDQTNAASATLSDDHIAGDAIALGFTSATFANKNAGVGKTVTISGITASGADALNYSVSTTATTTATITPRALLVSATGTSRIYDSTVNDLVTIGDNRIAGDSLTVNFTGATFVDKNVGSNKPVTVSGITLSGTDALNYTPNATATTSASITQFALTIGANAANKIYDRTANASVTFTDNQFAGDSLTISATSATFPDKNVGGSRTVTVSGISVTGTDAINYTWNNSATAFANISPRPLTVSATGVNKSYDQSLNDTVTLGDNRVAGDSLTIIYGSATFADKNAGTNKPVNVGSIQVFGTDSSNYAANTTASTTATITPIALNVTATGINRVYDRTTNATVTLGDNRLAGDSLTASYTSASFADRNVGGFKPVSVSGIAISGTDALNYTANGTASTMANITPAPLTVSGVGATRIYDGTLVETVTLTDNRFTGDALTVTYSSASFVNKNAGTGKAINISGINVTGTDAGNYSWGNTGTGTGAITQRPLAVTAVGSSKAYDGATTASVTLSDNRLGGDSLNDLYSSAAFADKNVGNGKTINVIGITLSGTDALNYAPNVTTTATANVTPELTVAGTASADTLRLVLDGDGAHVDWFLNGSSVIGQLAVSDLSGLTINAGATGMAINLDRSGGNPLPALLNLNGTFTVNGLTGTDPLAGTTINLNRSTLYISYTDAAHDPIQAIRGDIRAGFNSGAWTGTATATAGAIRSTIAAQDGTKNTAIGYVDSSSGLIAGQPANTIKVMYTLYGDTGLIGSVGFNDFMRMTQHYTQNSGAIWSQGDFDYDGAVGGSDFTLVQKTYNLTLPAPTQTPAATSGRPTRVTTDPTPASASGFVTDPTPAPVVGAASAVSAAPLVSAAPAVEIATTPAVVVNAVPVAAVSAAPITTATITATSVTTPTPSNETNKKTATPKKEAKKVEKKAAKPAKKGKA